MENVMCKHCNHEAPGYDTTCTDCIHRLCMTAKTWEHYKNIVYAITQSYSITTTKTGSCGVKK